MDCLAKLGVGGRVGHVLPGVWRAGVGVAAGLGEPGGRPGRLREEKSARIANAAAGSSRRSVGARGGRSGSYDDWTKKDLIQRAREIGIKGRSSMSREQLISALRDH